VFPFFFGGGGGGRTVSFTCTQRRSHARIDLFLFQIVKSRIVFRQSLQRVYIDDGKPNNNSFEPVANEMVRRMTYHGHLLSNQTHVYLL
jgi:hypothetical protein